MLNRKAIRAILAKGRALPVQKRRALYAAEATACHWPMTEEEASFSAELVSRLPSGCAFFHGGQSGLSVGADLLPALTTGKDPQGLRGAIPARLTLTYVTTSFAEAAAYAARAAAPNLPGTIYRVMPAEPLEMDPEAIRCLSLMVSDAQMVEAFGKAALVEMATAFRCPRATVLGAAMEVEWLGNHAATAQGAMALILKSGPPQLTGPDGWGAGLELNKTVSPSAATASR